jgi:hypothetical protein
MSRSEFLHFGFSSRLPAVMLFLSGVLLLYTAITVPVQICLWSYDDPCNTFATLYFDVAVDSFFLVPRDRAQLERAEWSDGEEGWKPSCGKGIA